MLKLEITANLETSDHDGYCSGEECQYEKREIEKIKYVNLDEDRELKNFLENKYKDLLKNFFLFEEILEIKDINNNIWEKYLNDERPGSHRGSGYCRITKEFCEAGLGHHDYNFQILKVKITFKNMSKYLFTET